MYVSVFFFVTMWTVKCNTLRNACLGCRVRNTVYKAHRYKFFLELLLLAIREDHTETIYWITHNAVLLISHKKQLGPSTHLKSWLMDFKANTVRDVRLKSILQGKFFLLLEFCGNFINICDMFFFFQKHVLYSWTGVGCGKDAPSSRSRNEKCVRYKHLQYDNCINNMLAWIIRRIEN